LEVDLETKIDLVEYENFLCSQNNPTFTSSSKHISFLEDVLNLSSNFFTARKDNELVGAIPFFEKNSIHGKVINSLPFFGSHGGVLSNDFEIKKQLLKMMNNYISENDILSSVIITNPFNTENSIYEKFYNYNFVENRFTQCINLKSKTNELAWKNFEKRVRWTIKKCEKNNLSVKIVKLNKKNSTDFYEVYRIGMEIKKGRLKPPEFFNYIKSNFEDNQDYDVFVAYKGDLPIAYLLVLYYYPFAEYYMPAFKKEWSNSQGTSLLIWESIKHSIEKNIEFYNFGGTLANQKDLYLFKRGWGSVDYTYNYFIFADVDRIKTINVEDIKNYYENFYVISFDQLGKFEK